MSKHGSARLLLFLLLILLSVWYMTVVLDDGIAEFRIYFESLSLEYIAVAFVVCLLMCQVKAEVNVELLGEGPELSVQPQQLKLAYSLAQVVRYLPGKVLGIVTQSFYLTGKGASVAVWRSNVLQFLLTNLNSLPIIAFVFLCHWVGASLLLMLPVLLAISFYFSLRVNFFSFLLTRSPIFNAVTVKMAKIVEMRRLNVHKIWACLNVEWVLYVLVFVFLLGVSEWQKAIVLAALYSSASMLAALVIVAPSGLFAREAFFLWLGTMVGLGAAELVSLGIISRVFFTIGDLSYFGLRAGISYWCRRGGDEQRK